MFDGDRLETSRELAEIYRCSGKVRTLTAHWKKRADGTEQMITPGATRAAAARAMVDPRVSQPIFLIEPFVESALDQLSDGATAREGA